VALGWAGWAAWAARVKFLRHLAAVTLIVAAVVVLGLAWNHFAASALIGSLADVHEQAVPSQQAKGPPGPRAIRPAGTMDLGLSSMFNPVNLPDLRHTVVIEAGVIAAVVIIDAERRRSRRATRARQRAGSQSDDDDGADQ
jgi:hypothetical protein